MEGAQLFAAINTVVQTVVPSLCAHRSSLLAAAINGTLQDTIQQLEIFRTIVQNFRSACLNLNKGAVDLYINKQTKLCS